MSPAPDGDTFRILCVCTGNVFRSRAAEHYVRAGLLERLGPAAASFDVRSAGAGVADGRPIRPTEVAALQRYGLPLDERPSHRLTRTDVAEADLVLCADRSHRSAVLELHPGAMRRTFLLQELARVAEAAPGSVGLSSLSPPARARRVVAAAVAHRTLVPPDPADEIADPWARPEDVLASAVDLVRHAVRRILDPLVGEVRADGGLDGGRGAAGAGG